LKKGYVNLGLGTYLSPFLEVSISNGRSNKGAIGLFTRTFGSAGKIELENDRRVNAGFLDNQALLYGKKYFRRSRLDADIDFRHMTRHAYGYDPDVTGYDPDRKDIRALYYDVSAKARYFTMETDSSDLIWDATLRYNMFRRDGNGMQHNPGLTLSAGTEMFGLYGGMDADYDLYLFSKEINHKARSLFSVAPYITKGNEDWRFRFGVKVAADLKENHEPWLAATGSCTCISILMPCLHSGSSRNTSDSMLQLTVSWRITRRGTPLMSIRGCFPVIPCGICAPQTMS
jgi:hypothetical protein